MDGVVKGAVICAAAALLLGHALSKMDAGGRSALRNAVRAAVGGGPVAAAPVPLAPAPQAKAAPRTAAIAPATGFGEETVAPDAFGQFHAEVEIGGQRVPVMVDTGATLVVLSAEDADRLGIRPMPSDFRYTSSTANGAVAVARVSLPSVQLGGITVSDVAALVSGRGRLRESLLGMSFLSRLSSMRIDRGRLVLAR